MDPLGGKSGSFCILILIGPNIRPAAEQVIPPVGATSVAQKTTASALPQMCGSSRTCPDVLMAFIEGRCQIWYHIR